jgi:hypothetical protein
MLVGFTPPKQDAGREWMRDPHFRKSVLSIVLLRMEYVFFFLHNVTKIALDASILLFYMFFKYSRQLRCRGQD